MALNKRTRSRRINSPPAPYDLPLLGIVAILAGLGLVMVFSASYVQANTMYGESTYYFMRQLRWLALGVLALAAAASINYRWLQKPSLLLMGGTVVLLLLVLVFGGENFGARRHLFGPSVQPSEIGKLTITIYIAYWLTSKGDRLKEVSYGLVPFAVLLGLVAGLLVLQPDFGTTVLVVVTALVMFFVAGADTKQLAISLVVAAVTLYLAVTRFEYAYKRVTDYLAGLADPATGSYQTSSGLRALASGGLFGSGIGEGWAKNWGGVPFPWTDSIFAIIGEELGLVGSLAVVVLFMALCYRGLRIALKAEDQFGMVLGCGITAGIGLQAFVNMAVNTAMLPFSGLTLPFISYGGSSLLATMAGVGVLLSISRYGQQPATSRSNAGNRGTPIQPERAAPALGRWNWRPRLPSFGRTRRLVAIGQSGQRRTSRRSISYSQLGDDATASGRYSLKASSAQRLGFKVTRTRRAINRRTRSRQIGSGSQASARRIPRRR